MLTLAHRLTLNVILLLRLQLCRGQGIRRLLQDAMLAEHQVLKGSTQVGQDMPAIGDLLCTRRSLPSSVGVGSSPITTHDLDARMFPEPGGQRLGSSIGEEVYPAAVLQINQDRAIGLAAAEREVINAKHTGCTSHWKRGTTDDAQHYLDWSP